MNSSMIIKEILSMPAELRAEIADALLKSLNPASEPGIEDAWVREAEDRLTAYNNGLMNASDARDASARLKKKYSA